MKLIIIMVLFTACALPKVRSNKVENITSKIHRCVVNLIGGHGVEAEKATKVCTAIYKATR